MQFKLVWSATIIKVYEENCSFKERLFVLAHVGLVGVRLSVILCTERLALWVPVRARGRVAAQFPVEGVHDGSQISVSLSPSLFLSQKIDFKVFFLRGEAISVLFKPKLELLHLD